MLSTASLCPAIFVMLLYLLTVRMNFVVGLFLGINFARRFRFGICVFSIMAGIILEYSRLEFSRCF